MTKVKSIPIPIALKELIISNNQLLQNYQQEMTNRVISANEEMMRMLGLEPTQGWRLDMGTFTYVKIEETNDSSVSE